MIEPSLGNNMFIFQSFKQFFPSRPFVKQIAQWSVSYIPRASLKDSVLDGRFSYFKIWILYLLPRAFLSTSYI